MKPNCSLARLKNMELPRDRYGIVRRRVVIARGYTDDHLEWHVKNKELHRLGNGAYAVIADLPADSADRDAELYRLRCLSHATSGRGSKSVLSHQSAAAVHGLAVLKADRTRVHTVNVARAGGAVLKKRHLHTGPVPPAQRVAISGVPVTSLVRTAVDVACAAGTFEGALTVFDSALDHGASSAALEAELDAHRRVGIAMARRALAHADSGAKSAGESWCRAQMIDDGLPLPRLQVHYLLPSQDAFVDFDWENKLVGEFDGACKYRVPDTATAAQAAKIIMREKRRQDEIEALGPKVVRCRWKHLERREVAGIYRFWLSRLGVGG